MSRYFKVMKRLCLTCEPVAQRCRPPRHGGQARRAVKGIRATGSHVSDDCGCFHLVCGRRWVRFGPFIVEVLVQICRIELDRCARRGNFDFGRP